MYAPPNAPEFNDAVFALVRSVPAGRVTTYGRVAELLPTPQHSNPDAHRRLGARWVGSALHACPPDVPWHRVINAQGRISFGPGAVQQHALLSAEGVQFSEAGAVSLQLFGWPAAAASPPLL
ncbi:methylated-DNA--protein-cysteine methyltransferase [Anaerolineae bacterium]|nr:methylated-DNA--protein-cysteine methyltransferase [Anaerolineae bacterium]